MTTNILCCTACEGSGEVKDLTSDTDSLGYYGYMSCPACGGTGSIVERIGVQAIPGLTSTPRHGASVSSAGTPETPRGAEAVALSFQIDGTLAAANLLLLRRGDSDVPMCMWNTLDHAYTKLSNELRQMLTGGVL